jgi:hypothetical protein
MNDEFEIRFVHTERCSVCKGKHAEYRNRPGCIGCQPLHKTFMEYGYAPMLQVPIKYVNVQPSLVDRIFALEAAGIPYKEIASVTGLTENTVNYYVYKANKESGNNRSYHREVAQ